MARRTSLGVAVALLALAACDSNDVPSPAQREADGLRPPSPQVTDTVELRGDGLAAGPEAFYFAAGRREVETALSAILGEPSGTSANDECGAGPMEMTDFEGGLTVNTANDVLVGWLWRMPQEGDAPPAQDIALVGDLQLGSSRAEAEAARGFLAITDSTLGEEFSLGTQLGGFIEADQVSMLYAGTQCFFR
ncbi:MAG: aspartate-semialdehyde dehydrogenase [Pseudomonadota bacterium]